MTESYNSFQVEQRQVFEAAKILHLDQGTTELLAWPQREYKFTLPLKMDSGEVKVFHGYHPVQLCTRTGKGRYPVPSG